MSNLLSLIKSITKSFWLVFGASLCVGKVGRNGLSSRSFSKELVRMWSPIISLPSSFPNLLFMVMKMGMGVNWRDLRTK